jgi:hypothetical protein
LLKIVEVLRQALLGKLLQDPPVVRSAEPLYSPDEFVFAHEALLPGFTGA